MKRSWSWGVQTFAAVVKRKNILLKNQDGIVIITSHPRVSDGNNLQPQSDPLGTIGERRWLEIHRVQ